MFFNRIDRLGNADRLCDEWMSLDMKPALCLILRDQRRYSSNRPLRLRVCRILLVFGQG
jgi:hypothetical protein